MLGGWPEPFGLVAIESMATGTPVIARRAGAFTETIEHGVTGFLVDDVERGRDGGRAVSATSTAPRSASARIERFSPGRMVDEYEAAYRRVLATRPGVR